MIDSDDNSISGYLTDIDCEPVSAEFTDVELFAESGHCILLRARRYGRWWLLKGLKAELASLLIYRRMLRKEFDTIIRMQHPGIVAASEMVTLVGHFAGQYIAMEWIEGLTLDQCLQAPRSSSEKLNVFRQLTSAVQYIHSQGFVHRDLKPQNIIITHNGQFLKLIDFGLADAEFFSILKQPAGTMGYISPEQQSFSDPDVRNDIYSLGCILRSMKLGIRYKAVISRCLAPLDRRYPDVARLQKAVDTANHRHSLMIIGLAALFLVAISITVIAVGKGRSLPDNNPSKVVANKAPAAIQSDTLLSANIAETPLASPQISNQQISTLPKQISVKESSHSNNAVLNTISTADSLLQVGIMIFEKEAMRIDLCIDTLSSDTRIANFGTPDKAWRQFYHSTCARYNLSDDEFDYIYFTLNKYSSDRYALWQKQLKSK